MNKTSSFFLSIITIIFILAINSPGQSIEQQLEVVQNDGIVGGSFKVAVQVKGTSLSAANTIGSATIDVQFNNTHLTYVDATNSPPAEGPSFLNGYQKTNSDNVTFIRIGVIGTTVYPGAYLGFDLGTSYTTWSTLNFTIQSTVTTSLTIDNITNAIGLYGNHANDPNTGVITDQPLTAPVNILNEPLPVELSSFAAKMYDQDKVKLNWSTQTEVNNYGFDVERQANNEQWEKVGFVIGNGNSNSPKEYSYIDKNLIGGSKFFYRLKQVDNDGQFEYSDIVEVGFVPSKFELYQNYPNPFNPSTKIRYQLPTESKVVIKIYNILGSEVMELINEQKEAGIYEAEFNASNLSSGTYIYKISADNFVQTKKMILMK